MTTGIAQLVQKTIAGITSAVKTAASVSYQKTIFSNVVQGSKTKLEYVAGVFFNIFSYLFSDQVSANDQATRNIGKNPPRETVTTSDTNTKTFGKNITDPATVTDSVSRTVSYSRTQPDTTTVADNIVRNIGSNSSDQVTAADVVSRTVSYDRTQPDSISLEDSLGKSLTKGTLTDNTTVADNIVRNIGSNPGDQATATDVVSRTVSYDRTQPDSTSLQDSLGKDLTKGTLTDNTTVADNIVRNIGSNSSDQATATDSLSNSVSKILPTDSYTVADSVSRTVSYNRTESDAVTVQDSITKVQNHSNLTQDSFLVTDDYYGLATIDDEQYADVGKNIFDTAAISDSIARTATFERILQDASTLTDLVSKTVTKPPVEDLASTADTVTRTIGSNSLDTANTSDIITRTAVYNRSLDDNSTVTDTVSRTVAFSRDTTDNTTVADNIVRNIGSNPSDQATATDVVSRTVSYDRTQPDTAAVTDSISKTVSRLATDQSNLADTLSKSITSLTQEVVGIALNIEITKANYFLTDYAPVDYAGSLILSEAG